MKLEAGKFYRTRDGRKAFVGYIDTELTGPYVLHQATGRVVSDDGIWVPKAWRNDGSFVGKNEYGMDLIAEWKDPPKAIWVNEYAGGEFYGRTTKGEADCCVNISPNPIRRAVKYIEAEDQQ